jgi:hypothetical protein
MPVIWNVSHSSREVVILVQGVVHLKEMKECVDGILTPATRSYRKLVNLVEGHLALDRGDLAALAAFVRERSESQPRGAVAIAVGSDESEEQLRLFDSLTVADRPFEIFRELSAARAWLDHQPSPSRPLWLEEPPLPARPDDAAVSASPRDVPG